MTIKPTVLVIDDEESIRKLLTTILKEKDYEVDSVENAGGALKKTDEKFYNVLLIDIVLPDMSGVELLPKIRETKPRMRRIIMTGNPSLQNAVEALNRGADAYIMKPLDIEKMLATIAEQLEKQDQEYKASVDTFQSGRLRARIELIKRIGSEV